MAYRVESNVKSGNNKSFASNTKEVLDILINHFDKIKWSDIEFIDEDGMYDYWIPSAYNKTKYLDNFNDYLSYFDRWYKIETSESADTITEEIEEISNDYCAYVDYATDLFGDTDHDVACLTAIEGKINHLRKRLCDDHTKIFEVKDNGDVFCNGRQIGQLGYNPDAVGMIITRFLKTGEYDDVDNADDFQIKFNLIDGKKGLLTIERNINGIYNFVIAKDPTLTIFNDGYKKLAEELISHGEIYGIKQHKIKSIELVYLKKEKTKKGANYAGSDNIYIPKGLISESDDGYVIRIMSSAGKEYFGSPRITDLHKRFLEPISATVDKKCITDNCCIFKNEDDADIWSTYEINGLTKLDKLIGKTDVFSGLPNASMNFVEKHIIDYIEVISVKEANFV